MDQIIAALIHEIGFPLAMTILFFIIKWLKNNLPPELLEFLTSATHQRDLAVVNGTLTRWAIAEIANPATPAPIPAEGIEYLKRNRADLLEKMSIAPEALNKMAAAAIATAAGPGRSVPQ